MIQKLIDIPYANGGNGKYDMNDFLKMIKY